MKMEDNMIKKLILIVLIVIIAGFLSHATESEKAAKDFVDLLVQEKFEDAAMRFDATMTKMLPTKRLQQIWKDLLAQMGAFQQQQSVRTEKLGPYTVVLVTCKFANVLLDVKVVYNKDQQVAGLYFAPATPPANGAASYVNKDTFTEKETTVGAKNWPLPGTLSVPKGKGPFPALILVHGSGPNDRDESIGPNKPFRDLAWGLASRGIAVLRYEKRTRHHWEKLTPIAKNVTVYEETIEDAIAAVPVLKKNPLIDNKKIFLLGHSLGGMLIPRIAEQDKKKELAGFIVLAGTTRALEDVILEQYNYLFSLDNIFTGEEQETLKKTKKQVAAVKSKTLSKETNAETLPLGVPAAYWLDLRGYRPAIRAKVIKRPMLILHGDRDYQVTIDDYNGWKAALSSHKNVSFELFPNLNHLFMKGVGKSKPDEYQVAGHVEQEVIEAIAKWLKN